MRVLDMTNAPEEEVTEDLCRVALELRGSGYSTEVMKKVMVKVGAESWTDTRELRGVERLTKDEARAIARYQDVLTQTLRRIEEWKEGRRE